jgi:uncharacterized protein YjbI with pentapeptide repeats
VPVGSPDGDLAALARQPNLQHIDLSMTRISDLGLLELKSLRQVETLNLRYAEQIGDEGLAAVKEWKRLRRVDLRGAKVTDTTLTYFDISGSQRTDSGLWSVSLTEKGVAAIATLHDLRELHLSGASIRAEGLTTLRRSLTKLERLHLAKAKRIGDAAVEVLQQWPTLRELDLRSTAITPQAIERLRAALPSCTILH